MGQSERGEPTNHVAASSFPLLKEVVLYRVMEFEFGTSQRGLNAGPMQIGNAAETVFLCHYRLL